MDDNWFLRNRMRDLIFQGIHVLRELQLLSGIRDSEVFRIVAKVYRDTGGFGVAIRLFYVIRELERDERQNRQR